MFEAIPLASGRDADVYAIDGQRVLRRYRDGGDVAVEARIMKYVATQGFPVPIIHDASGTDLVMERLDGPTMLSALSTDALPIVEAAALLAGLHHDLHRLPALRSLDPSARILHLDLHPDNVMLTSRGPVVIDWRNAREGPAELDVAMSALIIAQVAVEKNQGQAMLAAELLEAFLNSAGGCPVTALDQAVAIRQADANLTTEERTALPAAAALVMRPR